MFDRRLKQFRLARGYSLDELAAKTGGIITKQAISKYERGKIRPSAVVLNKLAEALGIKAAILFNEPGYSIDIVAFRKSAAIPQKEIKRVEAYVKSSLEERIQLQELTGLATTCHNTNSGPKKHIDYYITVHSNPIRSLTDVETAAENLREEWNLGLDEISNMTETLENNSVHVITIDTPYKLDGVSAIAKSESNKIKIAAVANKSGVPGERQRLNLAHELGHLILDIPETIDEEKAAFRFGAAFLAPEGLLRKEIGDKRAFIQPEELFMLKSKFGISIASLLYRMHDLDIITDSYYRRWCIDINKLGWKKNEPNELKPEQSSWVRMAVLRGLSEGLLTISEAARFLKEPFKSNAPLSLVEKKAFLRLPMEERRKILQEQATKLSEYYEGSEIKEMGGGDFVD